MSMLSSRQLQYLQLFHLQGCPHSAYSRLIRLSGSIQALHQAVTEDAETLNLDAVLRQVILDSLEPADRLRKPARDAAAWLDASPGHSLVCYEDYTYPPLLKQIECPPPLLFVTGDLTLLARPQLAMVGSRKASENGGRVARWLAGELVSAGFCITSGLAAGIDSQAHRGALSAAGKTLAVIGTGIDRIYPPGNRALAAEIEQQGALVSEFPLGTPPLAGNFPQRNRLIAGLSLGVIVVEATPRSGSLITARLALEANREVFAVPGSLFNGNSRGCHELIRNGAKLVDSVEAIMEELIVPEFPAGPAVGGQQDKDADAGNSGLPTAEVSRDSQRFDSVLHGDEVRLLELLEVDPCTLDSLTERSGLPIGKVTGVLTSLELRGLLKQAGGRFRRVVAGHNNRKFDPD
ncbi:MAG: DNA-protecting protein DprA [Pseudomonadales bacterium]|nr:DNA-protecting protein DprA [Pseudomonadales bacterium]